MDAFSDAKVAIRTLGRQKLFAAMSILSMTVGIGANTAIFTVANALLFRGPAGVADAERLVDIGTARDDGGLNPTSFPKYLAVRDQARSYDGVYARQMFLERLAIESGVGGAPVRGYADFVTLNYFTVLGLRPAFGRLFVASDPEAVGAAPIAVLSYRYWISHFNKSGTVIGETVRLNGQPFTIVGVAPDGFQGTGVSRPDLWAPVTAKLLVTGGSDTIFRNSSAGWLMIGARLKPGVTSDAASAEVLAIGRAIDLDPAGTVPRHLRAIPSSLFPGNRQLVAFFMSLLMGLIGLVLVVACVNVSGILMARGIARHQEMAVRLSLGATRARLVRQLLTETAAIALLGAAGGLVLARAAMALIAAWLRGLPFPIAIPLAIDARVTGYAVGLSVVAAFIAGLLPALRTSRTQPIAAIKGDDIGLFAGTRLRRFMVVAQVALSMTLVVVAGVFARAIAEAALIDSGFERRGVELTEIDLGTASYTPATGPLFAEQLLDRVRQLPGIADATLAKLVPGGFEVWRLGIGLPGGSRPGDEFVADTNIVAPGYFATLGIPVRAGRDFDAHDRAESQRVVIVDEQAARHYWPGESALGKQLSQFRGPDVPPYILEVVGVVGDVKSVSLIDGMSQSFVYVPFQQAYDSRMTIVTRSASTRSVATGVRRAIASMDASVAVTPATSLDDSVALGLVSQRVTASVAGSLGTFGLCLAAVGLYAVTTLTIVRRFREFGIRLALGAPRRQILSLILRQGLGLVLVGCAVGAVPAVGVGHVFGVFLVGLPAIQPVVIGGAAVLFLAVGFLACIGPALKASLVNPLTILR